MEMKYITFFNGIAIFFIVFFHEVMLIPSLALYPMWQFFAQIGLALFTFSSGYKLVQNHQQELQDKIFLSKYYVKRFIRLYKPYIGYSALLYVPVIIYTIITLFYPSLEFPFISNFRNQLTFQGLLNFITGNNYLAPQLWYLISLIIITAICFTVLYFFELKSVYFLFFPVLFFYIVFLNTANMGTASQAVRYLPDFIFGMFCGGLISSGRESPSMPHGLNILLLGFSCLFFICWGLTQVLVFIDLAGLTVAPLVMLFSVKLVTIPIFDRIITPWGSHSFHIYLFQMPFVLPVLNRIISPYFIDYYPGIIAIFIVIGTIYICILGYTVTKLMRLNFFFE